MASGEFPGDFPGEGSGKALREYPGQYSGEPASGDTSLTEKRSRRKKDRFGTKKKQSRKTVGFILLSIGFACINVLAALLFAFDLTQIGGMAFGSIALLWLVYRLWIGRENESRSPWEEYILQMDDEEEEYLYEDDVPELGNTIRKRKGSVGGDNTNIRNTLQENEDSENAYGAEETVPDAGEEATRVLTENPRQDGCLLIGEAAGTDPIRIAPGEWTLGKSSTRADIVIASEAVSRVHAQANVQDNICSVRDLNSRNGTFINGVQIEPYMEMHLKIGDRVRFANVGYIVAEIKGDS